VLFLDEMPEFSRHALEVMRQPLEDGHVVISRVAGSCDYPSRFMLVAAMNPCPCGYWGDEHRECRCSRAKRMEYRNRVSGPLLDRIDIQIEVTPVSYEDLAQLPTGEPSCAIRERVVRAREIQLRRFADDPDVFCNAEMRSRDIARYCKLDRSAQEMLRARLGQLDLSARAYDRVLKVSRTIADLEGRDAVCESDIDMAAGWRALDRNYAM
jgi:magnesium chelatase family protein